MKQVLVILIIILSGFAYAQEKKIVYRQLVGENGTEKAIKDFDAGNYIIYSTGLISSIEDYGFNDYFKNYVFEKYKVVFVHRGCVSTRTDEFYDKKMNFLLFQKYGNNFLELARSHARKTFKQTESFEKIKKKIDSDDVFFSVHQEAEFIGGNKKLEKFLDKNIGMDTVTDWDDYLKIYFTIEKDGSVNDIVLKNLLDGKPYQGEDANKLLVRLKEMSNWQPAIFYDEVVRYRHAITVIK